MEKETDEPPEQANPSQAQQRAAPAGEQGTTVPGAGLLQLTAAEEGKRSYYRLPPARAPPRTSLITQGQRPSATLTHKLLRATSPNSGAHRATNGCARAETLRWLPA